MKASCSTTAFVASEVASIRVLIHACHRRSTMTLQPAVSKAAPPVTAFAMQCGCHPRVQFLCHRCHFRHQCHQLGNVRLCLSPVLAGAGRRHLPACI